ncbi:hypothetical protein LTS08_002589 [Lithohypha guttulata]|uniref:THO complex subunit 5 n=1 Tax=Lithohypha guttulata TaxID=1690604 RepID=A0AAN7Y9N7_9EURO|nr:hypothetical protein LTR51_001757 [Lithohypha guttulata]KAK5090507.1 hypothetical protein LTR05_000680 [Lithohypha guttulata]KAK5104698.1 hypothetical protein LTS08_002589 [Lithohypha guttulata]
MTVEDIIVAPELTPSLATAQATLQQTLAIIDLLSANATTPTTLELQRTVARQNRILQAYLARLKQQTRRTAFIARSTKAQTADARREVDGLLLQLQNLYYEQRHLLGEIAACEDYPHAFRELPLVDEEEYLEHFPEHEELDESALMERRINHEQEERDRIDEERKELVKRKDQLVLENTRRKEVVKKMDEKLESWVDGLAKLEEELKVAL